MFSFGTILTTLQGVIAARAARERALAVLLVALWGRIARMRSRLERLIVLWRAGKLPVARAPRAARARERVPGEAVRVRFPSSAGWLRRVLGHEASACASQLRHMLSEAECREFLAAVPQAGRMLRPLLRMLTSDAVPEVARVRVVVAPAAEVRMAGVGVGPVVQFLDG